MERLEVRQLLSGDLPVPAEPVDSEGTDLPRYLTAEEAEYLKTHTIGSGGAEAVSAPPTGPIDPVAEYEPMEGLVISWFSQTSILSQIVKRVTVEGGGRVYVGVTSASSQSSATTTLTNAGADMSKVTFFTVALNSVWARDYGPRYVYEGNVRVITDHVYNRPRPLDDVQPAVFAALKKHQIYNIGLGSADLYHGGGNFHLNGSGDAYATELIVNENRTPANGGLNPNGPLSSSQIQQIWNTYEGDTVTITQPFPTSVDLTQHIDMWMQIFDDDKVFISDWPNNIGSTQDVICDSTATLMQSRGYQVTRIPAYSISGTHYTFANMVVFNNIVLLPQYNNGPGSAVSNTVFSQVQSAFTPLGKTVYQINADAIVSSAGVFHCIVQHIPKHLGLVGVNGGLAPTAYLRGPNTGGTYLAGQQINLQWISDDDAPVAASGGVTGVDLLLSTDGGLTFPTTIASNQPALGSFTWTVPVGINTSQARIRVVARDGLNNTGYDDTDSNFTIGLPSAVPGRPALDPASDTGLSNSDHLTRLNNSSNASQLVFDIDNTIAGATVRLYSDGVLIGSAVASGTTTSILTDGVTTLVDGSRVITATMTEPGKAESAMSLPRAVSIDTAPPGYIGGDFEFESEQRYDIVPNDVVLLADATLTNTTTGQVLSGSDLAIAYGNVIVSIRKASGLLADGNWNIDIAPGALSDAAGNVSNTPFHDTFFVLAGDATRNKSVNSADFNILATNFGTSGKVFSQGNFSYDANGDVNSADFNILATNFGVALPGQGEQSRGGSNLPGGIGGAETSGSLFSGSGRIGGRDDSDGGPAGLVA